MSYPSRAIAACSAAVALLASACGGGSTHGTASTTSSATASATQAITLPAAALAAEQVRAGEFPTRAGRSLQQLAATLQGGPQLGLAVSVLLPGRQRLAFGLLSSGNEPLYANTPVYIASNLNAAAPGPYPAPLDPMVPPRPYLSKTVATD